MRKKMKISYKYECKKQVKNVNYDSFVFDGCHKIYLLNKDDVESVEKAKEYEYKEIYSIKRLPEFFKKSCPLKFINTFKELESIVPQFATNVRFSNFKGVKNG